MINEIIIREIQREENLPYDLLLLADPSRECIDRYIADSFVYTARLEGKTVACYVLYKIDQETAEIKNMAVDESYQGKGIGRLLLEHAAAEARKKGFRRLLIGTGNSSIGQLYLYQKAGFRIVGIKPDFFTENYAETIVENGIECRDMVVLSKDL